MVAITTCPDCKYPTYILGKTCPQCSGSVSTYKQPKQCRYCEYYKWVSNLHGHCILNPRQFTEKACRYPLTVFSSVCGQFKRKEQTVNKYFGI